MRARVLFDGASKGNPGPAGGGARVEFDDGTVAEVRAPLPAPATNNVAEYRGLIAGLEEALRRGATEVEAVGDSELVVRQVTGRYAVRMPHLVPLHAEVLALSRRLRSFRIAAVPRARNAAADLLANEAAEAAARALGRR